MYGSEFENTIREPGLYSFSLLPSAHYKATPISHSSLLDNLPISFLALSFISFVRAILISFIFCAPLLVEASFFAVNFCFWFSANLTLFNHKDKDDLATGTCYRISL